MAGNRHDLLRQAVTWLLIAVVIYLLWCSFGCQMPRIFQSKVPEPVVKTATQVESERAAADLIARKIETPVELRPVAVSLSASLGTPARSLVDVKTFSLPQAAAQANGDLRSDIAAFQHRLDETNARLTKLQGKDVEGTGVSLLGPGMVTIIVGLIILGVVFPPAFTLLFMAFKRLRSTTGKIVNGIESISDTHESNPAISELKSKLAASMDTVEKRVVHAFQKP